MIRILLVRHGHTVLLGQILYGRMPGVQLSAEGYRQAETLAQNLRLRYLINEVISSPLERATETAKFIADGFAVPLSVDQRIDEVDFGSWIGLRLEDLDRRDEWREFNRLRSVARPPGGETMLDIQARSWDTLQDIAQRYGEGDATIALVTHGDVVRSLLLLLLGMPPDYIHRLDISPASVSEVVLHGLHPRVMSVNQTFTL